MSGLGAKRPYRSPSEMGNARFTHPDRLSIDSEKRTEASAVEREVKLRPLQSGAPTPPSVGWHRRKSPAQTRLDVV
jgi:hypothetical protein